MTLIIINVPQCFLVEACGLGRVNNWHFFKLDTLQRMTLGQNSLTEGIDAQKGKGSAEGIVLTKGIESVQRPSQIYFSLIPQCCDQIIG